MKKRYVYLFILAFVFINIGILSSQNLPYLNLKVLKNDTLHFKIKSNAIPPIEIITPQNGDVDNISHVSGTTNPKVYDVQYVPNAGFTGYDKVVLEYRGNPGTSLFDWPVKKVVVDIEVLNSILDANTDYALVNINSQGDTIDVLSNDSTTADSLYIERILNATNGTAYISDDNKVVFTPAMDFSGKAFFNYVAADNAGSRVTTSVLIDVQDGVALPDTLHYFVTNTTTVNMVMQESGFALDSNALPLIGGVDFANDPVLVYRPEVDSTGTDQFNLVKNGDTLVIVVDVFEGKDKGMMIIDDEVYTGKGATVSFNVQDNDYKKNNQITYTDVEFGTLEYLGQGNFEYTPNDGFEGIDEFTYTVRLSYNHYQTATVKIYVDNFVPDNTFSYDINTSQGSEVVLDYRIPIDGYSFNLMTPPLEGTVNIYPGEDTVYVNCSDITGKYLIVYTPPADYTGIDRFELEYCPPDNDCRIVKVNINIVEEQSDTTCPCAAYNCVWSGDTDNNGKVDAKDLLPVGYYLGHTGGQRTYQTANWLGHNAPNWQQVQSNGFNLKHVDSDGDGVITALDTLEILSHYNKTHNLYTNAVMHEAEFPIYMIPEQEEVDSGEVAVVHIYAGSEEYPAKELLGLSYTLMLDPAMVDSASLHHRFEPESWLVNGTATLDISNQYQDGMVDAAIVRIKKPGATGIGKIARCDWIVEDDIDGGKLGYASQERIPVRLRFTNGTAITSNGSYIRLPRAEAIIYYKNKTAKHKKAANIKIYPNPAGNKTKISITGGDKIAAFSLYNSLGRILKTQYLNEAVAEKYLDLGDMNTGLYFIEIITDKNKKYTQKLEIIKF